MKKVYVIFDPLREQIICVHDNPGMECKDCKKAQENKDGYQRNDYYPLQEIKMTLKTGYVLTPIKDEKNN